MRTAGPGSPLVLIGLLAVPLAGAITTLPRTAEAAVGLQQRIAGEALGAIDTGPTDDSLIDGQSAYRPRHLFDNLRWTAWCGPARPQRGVGTKIRIEFPAVHYLGGLQLINGDIRSPKELRDGVQTRSLRVRTERGEHSFTLARNVAEPQPLELPAPEGTRWVELLVEEVYPGGGRGPCYSELALLEPKDLLAVQPALLEEIQQLVPGLRGPDTAPAAATRLIAIGSPAAPWLQPLLREPDVDLQLRVVELFGALGDPQAAPALEDTYRRTSDKELQRRILATLGKLEATSAVPFLVEQTRAKDPELARQALLSMEGFGDDRTIQPFLQAVLREDEEVARIAIRHLAGFGPKAYQALLPALSDPSLRIRERATWAMGRIDVPQARQAVMRQLQSGSGRLVVAALRGLGERPSEENFAIVGANVHHDEQMVREAVADALGGFAGKREAAEHLRELAADPQAEVRRRAFNSLMRLGEVAVPEVLGLAHDSDGPLLDETLAAAGRFPAAQASKLHVELLGDRREPVRDRAMAWIDARGAEGLTSLIAAMGHEDPRVRFIASRRVGELGEAGLPLLHKEAVDSADPQVRQACLRAIARVGSPLSRATVARGLTDPVGEVRREALAAAHSVPWEGYAPMIPGLLEREPRDAHLLAVEVAGTSRLREAVPVLLRQLEEGHPNSIRIIWALGRIGDPAALPALASRATSAEGFTRQMAVGALGGIKTPEAMKLLFGAMLDGDPMVRQAAEKALSGQD